MKSSPRRAGGNTYQEQSGGEAAVREVPPVLEAPRRVRDTGTRASAKRTLGKGVEAAREDTPQIVSFDTPFQTGERELSVKIYFFIEQGGNAMKPEETISGDDVHNCSEEEQKRARMRETRILTFMQIELEACRDWLYWLIICHNCAAYNCQRRSTYQCPYLFLPITSTTCRVEGQGNEGHIATPSKDDSQDVLSSTRLSTAAGNFIMLARGEVGNIIRSAVR